MLKKIICRVDEETGKSSLESSGEIIRGQLSDNPTSSGSMKHAYNVSALYIILSLLNHFVQHS